MTSTNKLEDARRMVDDAIDALDAADEGSKALTLATVLLTVSRLMIKAELHDEDD